MSARFLLRSLKTTLLAGLAASALASAVPASSLVFQPQNPNFGGSPLNGGFLQSQADAQNEFKRKEQRRQQILSDQKKPNQQESKGQEFARILQSQLYSSLANKITQAIFGENAQTSGTFTFDGTRIDFQRVGSNVKLTIFDGTTTTVVTVPSGI